MTADGSPLRDERRGRAPPARGIASRWAAAAVAVLVALGALAGSALGGDPEMAKFLLKGAKADIAKKQFDAAFTKLQRAEQEDPKLVESAYWMGFVLEKRDDARAAVAAYRRFLAGVTPRLKARSATRDETDLAKKAQERVDAIAAGEVERRKLDDSFVEGLVAFAKTNLAKDSMTAGEALQIALSLRPDHAEALKLKARLGLPATATPDASKSGGDAPPKPAPGASPAGGDLGDVKTWRDMLADHTFNYAEDWETKPDGVIAVRYADGGTLRTPAQKLTTLPTYALEMECRVVESLDRSHTVGFGFSFEKVDGVRSFYAVGIKDRSLRLAWSVGTNGGDALTVALPEGDESAWHKIGVIVHGLHIDLFADGQKIGEFDDPRRKSLVGEPAIFVENCRGEVRSFRLGTPP